MTTWKKGFVLILLIVVAPAATAQINYIASDGLTNDGINNWADGAWYVRAVVIDGVGTPVGSLSNELIFNIDSSTSPGFPFVTVDLVSSAPGDNSVRYYRRLGAPIVAGAPGVEYADEACSVGSCGHMSNYDYGLSETLTWNTGTVVPVDLIEFTID